MLPPSTNCIGTVEDSEVTQPSSPSDRRNLNGERQPCIDCSGGVCSGNCNSSSQPHQMLLFYGIIIVIIIFAAFVFNDERSIKSLWKAVKM